VNGFLRFVGLVNAAVWLGAGIFFAAGVLPGIFSTDMRHVLGDSGYPYYSGAVALVLFKRFFILQYVCGTIALAHLVACKLYLGRALPRLDTALAAGILVLGLVGGFWLQPRMESLRKTMYSSPNLVERDTARHSFGMWHGVSEGANLLVIVALLVYLMRVARPGESARHGIFTKFWC